MDPSLGSARLVRFFQKARVEKNGKNEPIWGLFKNSIWKSLILTKKINFFLYNSPKGPIFSQKIGTNWSKKQNRGVILNFLP